MGILPRPLLWGRFYFHCSSIHQLNAPLCDAGSERRAGRAAVASARRRRGNFDHLICSVEFFFLKQIKQDETASEPQVREILVVINESSGSLAPGAPDRSPFLFDPLIFRVFAIYIKQKMGRNAYFFCSPP